MALIKPIAQTKNAFDANSDNSIDRTFYFTMPVGNIVEKNRLTIKSQEDNTTVYSEIITTYALNHTIPKNTLENGKYYYYYFNTYNANNEESENSNIVPFWCYSVPTVTFTNLPLENKIDSASFDFEFKYVQDEGELLDYIVFNLYDSTNRLVKTSGNIYANDDNEYNYTISGLENEADYIAKLEGTTLNGLKFKSEEVRLSVIYATPMLFSQLDLFNKCDKGYIQIKSNVVIADGESYPDPPIYIDNDKIDLTTSGTYVQWVQGYNLAQDFTLQLWGEFSNLNSFFKMWNEESDDIILTFVRDVAQGETEPKDYFTVSARVNGEEKVFARSNTVPIMNGSSKFVVWVRKVGTVWTLKLDVLEQIDSVLIWDEKSVNVEYNKMSGIRWNSEGYAERIGKLEKFENIDSIFPINHTKLFNGVYDHIYITKNTTNEYSSEIPQWDYDTELECDFKNNINGGNVNILLTQLTAIKIKRRAQSSVSLDDWITLKQINIESVEDLNISLQDSFVPSGVPQQYAIVPILQGNVEGDYIISEILPQWNGLFVSNTDTIFKMYSGVAYGGNTNNKLIGSLQPIGKKYPVIVQNGKTQYTSGSVSGNLYGYNFEQTREIDRNSVVIQTQDFVDMLTESNCVCITDWNGNIWLGAVTNPETIAFNSASGNAFTTLTFNFAEQGKYNNKEDLYINGLIESVS